MDAKIIAAIITALGVLVGVILNYILSRKKRGLPEEVVIGIKLGYSVQELLAILDTADPRICDQYAMTAQRMQVFRECRAKVSALSNLLDIEVLDDINFQHDENDRISRYFISIFEALPVKISNAFKIGASLGKITLRCIPYSFRYNIIGLEENSKKFLNLAIEEYNNLKPFWIALTAKKKLPESFKLIEKLINSIKAKDPKNSEITLDEMDSVIKQCDAASKSVIGEIEANVERNI